MVEAYRRLEGEGLVEQRPGSGTYVRPSAALRAARFGSARLAAAEGRPVIPPGTIDLAGLTPHERGYPSSEFAACVQRVVADRGGQALGYGPTAGDLILRESLAERLTARGLSVDASRILLVGGAQQGLDLLFRTCLQPGDAVVTETPTYHLALELLRFHGARIHGIPLAPAEGRGASTLDVDALQDAITRHRPRLAYTMPRFQNPTGLSLDAASRRRLATACREAGVLLVEDDYEADMRHEGPDLAPVATLPEAGEVAYVGTLSKALFPGLRIGWVVASPEMLTRLAQVKRLSDLSGSTLLQAIAAELIVSGVYDRHLEGVVASTRERMRLMVDALQSKLPAECQVTSPQGGHVLWVEAPAPSGRALAEAASAEGVIVTPGENFAPDELPMAGVRVSVARIEPSEVEEAATRLARAVAKCMDDGRRRPSGGRDMERAVEV